MSPENVRNMHADKARYAAGIARLRRLLCAWLPAELRVWLEARRAGRPPLEARVLQGILDASEVPYRCGCLRQGAS